MYACICFVAKMYQRIFRNSSLQMFSMRVHGKLCRSRSEATGGPPQELDAYIHKAGVAWE